MCVHPWEISQSFSFKSLSTPQPNPLFPSEIALYCIRMQSTDFIQIYGIGRTMWDLMDMHIGSQRLKTLRARTYDEYKSNGYHQLPEVWTQKPGVYTFRLRNLIHRCLDPNPAKRPSQIELYDETLAGYRMAKRRVEEARAAAAGLQAERASQCIREDLHSLTSSKLYYKGRSINKMPVGDAGFEPALGDLQRVVFNTYLNPDLPKLNVPKRKWGEILDSSEWKERLEGQKWRKLYSKTNSCQLWFEVVKADWGNGGADGDGNDDSDEGQGTAMSDGRFGKSKSKGGRGKSKTKAGVQKNKAPSSSPSSAVRGQKMVQTAGNVLGSARRRA